MLDVLGLQIGIREGISSSNMNAHGRLINLFVSLNARFFRAHVCPVRRDSHRPFTSHLTGRWDEFATSRASEIVCKFIVTKVLCLMRIVSGRAGTFTPGHVNYSLAC